MNKFALRLTQVLYFENEEECFEALTNSIGEAQKDGFDLVKIKGNKYCLKEKEGNGNRMVEVIKKDD